MRNKRIRSAIGSVPGGSVVRLLCTVLSAVWLVSLAACGQTGDGDMRTAGEERLRIVTTIFPPYDFVKQIGGEHVEITMLLKPGMESHSYEPSPADIIQIMNSDIFIYAGGESDVWVESLLEGNDGDVESYALLDWVDPLEEETVEGMQVKAHGEDAGREGHGAENADAHTAHEAEAGESAQQLHAVHLEEAEYDEHVWTSPQNAMVIVDAICDVMSQKDPAHAALFAENAAAYQEELKALDGAFEAVVEHAKRKTIVFGDRFPLLYFVKTYGLDYYAAFPGCSMETEPSAATIAFLTDKVRAEQIPVIFYLEMSNGKIAGAIAETTGAETMVFYSGHSITASDLSAGEDYVSLMYRNVEALKAALETE